MKAATYKETVKAAHEGFHIRMFITVLFIMTKKKKRKEPRGPTTRH